MFGLRGRKKLPNFGKSILSANLQVGRCNNAYERMTVKFNNDYLRNLYAAEPLKGKPLYSKEVVSKFQERVLLMEQLENTKKLREFKSLHFEALKGDKKGLYSIRLNKQYRIEFKIENEEISLLEIILIEELSKHYE